MGKNINAVNCQFTVQCNQIWEELIFTDDEHIRHCPRCDKDVHLPRTVDEINQHIHMNVCMAIPLTREEVDIDGPYPGHIVGQLTGHNY